MSKYEVQHNTICDGWVNTWTDDGAPTVFDSKAEANAELDSFLDDTLDDFRNGYLDEPYNRSEFRVVLISK
jgi:hypothetical protein